MRRDGFTYYRWQADRCRQLAERQPEAAVKARLLDVARQYEGLAQDAERHSASSTSGHVWLRHFAPQNSSDISNFASDRVQRCSLGEVDRLTVIPSSTAACVIFLE